MSRAGTDGHEKCPRATFPGGLAALTIALAGTPPLTAQIPDSFTNLQVLPGDISRDSLVDTMRRFSLSLGVSCQYCHTGGDGVSFEGVEFDRDDDPDKLKARAMLRMVEEINGTMLAALPDRDQPPTVVSCKTCHRGLARPTLLAQELRRALDASGPYAAVQLYEQLRSDLMEAGMFDFREWEVNLLAEELAAEERVADAIAIYELNARFYGQSISIHLALGQLHETGGDLPSALASYRRVLQIDESNAVALERLAVIEGGPG